MAHFAQLDTENQIINVVVVNNEVILDENGVEKEQIGIDFCKSIFGQDTAWVQTSYNKNFRKNYAVIGGSYDATKDAFIDQKPFPSWILDENTCKWIPPTPEPLPDPNNWYQWDEPTQSWVAKPLNA
jgi:hypothetical protein